MNSRHVQYQHFSNHRALQDLAVHQAEIHSKLVSIMRERLLASLKQLPAAAALWARQLPSEDLDPSAFSQNTAKQLRILAQAPSSFPPGKWQVCCAAQALELAQVLTPMMQEEDLHLVFGRVAAMFSKLLSDAYLRLDPQASSVSALQAELRSCR